MSADSTTDLLGGRRPSSLDFWMAAVVRECDRIPHDFASEPVHDLRVALRRCRSIADGFMTLDPHPAWRLMRDESKRLFQQLGALRDVQVMREWVQRLAPLPEEDSFILHSYLEEQENLHQRNAAEAILEFNRKKWASWARTLTGRTRAIPPESIVLQHLVLERWADVHALHSQAMRNRTHAAYHRLRIALKKFRYAAETFLPSQHGCWGAELKAVQDLLGEMHDLDVLWRTALTIKAIRNEGTRREWHRCVRDEAGYRLQVYRKKMLGKASLLTQWRSGLPSPNEIRMAALARFRVWASFRDPDVSHSGYVSQLALQLYDGLDILHLLPSRKIQDARTMLEAAAFAHAVGYGVDQKKYEIASYRMIRKLPPLLGLSVDALRWIALITRFHRGRLPRAEQKAFSGLTSEQRRMLVFLSGILRLADALCRLEGRRIYRLHIERAGDVLWISVPGYSENSALAEKLASAGHLLEVACRLPILCR